LTFRLLPRTACSAKPSKTIRVLQNRSPHMLTCTHRSSEARGQQDQTCRHRNQETSELQNQLRSDISRG